MKSEKRFFFLLARGVIRYRIGVLLGVLFITVLLGSQVRFLQFDTSNEGFLHPDDPIMTRYNEFRDQFGRDDMLVLTVKSEKVFTREFLAKLTLLHEQLWEDVPHVNDIISLVNARSTRGEGDVLLVDDLLAEFPETEEDFQVLKEQVLSNPLYLNQLISPDGKYTTIVIESEVYTGGNQKGDIEEELLAGFGDEPDEKSAIHTEKASGQYLSDEENSEFVQAVQQLVAEYNSDDFQIYIAGSPIVMDTIKQFMKSDVQRFMRLAVLIIGICLFIMFRNISGVVLPLLTVAFSLLTTVGIMVVCGISFKLPTTILPSFLLAVGVGAAVHVLSLTYRNIRHGQARNEAIVNSFSHSGFAIVMTSMTTAAGLASFGFAKVAPIADLGLFSAIGVMISLIYTLTFLPAVLSLLPVAAIQHRDGKSSKRGLLMDRILDRISDFAVDRKDIVIGVWAVALIIAGAGIIQLRFAHNVLYWLPENLDVRKATELIDKEMRGSVVLEVLVDSGVENGLYDRELLLTIDKTVTMLEEKYEKSEVFIGKTISPLVILKEIHQALHGNDPTFYIVPENKRLIPQEFLLFENSGSDDLEDVVDSQFRKARITIKVPWQDALLYQRFMTEVKDYFEQELGTYLRGKESASITVSGIMSIFGRIIHAAMYSAAQSYGIALAIISLMMIVLIGDLRLGLVSMIPNLSPILAVLGLMGWLNIPLDMFTMLIASIAIGLAVDDTVHFMYNFKYYYRKTGEVKQAVYNTLHTAGRAMVTTSVVLSIGFLIFTFAAMNNLYYFGLLTGAAIILALASDLFLAPALMALLLNTKKNINPLVQKEGELC